MGIYGKRGRAVNELKRLDLFESRHVKPRKRRALWHRRTGRQVLRDASLRQPQRLLLEAQPLARLLLREQLPPRRVLIGQRLRLRRSDPRARILNLKARLDELPRHCVPLCLEPLESGQRRVEVELQSLVVTMQASLERQHRAQLSREALDALALCLDQCLELLALAHQSERRAKHAATPAEDGADWLAGVLDELRRQRLVDGRRGQRLRRACDRVVVGGLPQQHQLARLSTARPQRRGRRPRDYVVVGGLPPNGELTRHAPARRQLAGLPERPRLRPAGFGVAGERSVLQSRPAPQHCLEHRGAEGERERLQLQYARDEVRFGDHLHEFCPFHPFRRQGHGPLHVGL
mmetsp:Transcript_22010/g.50402  ORF Transcript_22010/g.50402 Transcript_22010/m.50402 type:complete len:348 (-) Transcript_22010:275-1318(-)